MGKPKDSFGKDLPAGARHYRAFVGGPVRYDLRGAVQFNLLTFLGLREHHYLLDIGCGSLSAGRLFIPYLLPGRYFGIEPEQWLIEEGISNEVGRDLLAIKKPVFSNDSSFMLSAFNKRFDFILANSVFTHTSQRQITRCLSEAGKVMGPASLFAATFVEGDEDYAGDDWVYPDCVAYTLERLTCLAEEQHLICKPLDWPHPAQQSWVIFTDPANEQFIPAASDATRMLWLESEVRTCRERLARMESHPYVRFGLRVFRLLGSIRPSRRTS